MKEEGRKKRRQKEKQDKSSLAFKARLAVDQMIRKQLARLPEGTEGYWQLDLDSDLQEEWSWIGNSKDIEFEFPQIRSGGKEPCCLVQVTGALEEWFLVEAGPEIDPFKKLGADIFEPEKRVFSINQINPPKAVV